MSCRRTRLTGKRFHMHGVKARPRLQKTLQPEAVPRKESTPTSRESRAVAPRDTDNQSVTSLI